MSTSSNHLNIKYLENSDVKDSNSNSHSSPNRSANNKSKLQTHRHQKEKVESNELSNDASNENSDFDNGLTDTRRSFAPHATTQVPSSHSLPDEPNMSTRQQPPFLSVPRLANAPEGNRFSALSLVSLADESARDSLNPDNTSGKLSQTGLQKTFFCKICNHGFTRKHNMISHELTHTSLKIHRCGVCDMPFRRIHDLKRHKKLHTGEKPFQCSKCLRNFARTDALSRHLNSANACTGNILRGQATGSISRKDVSDSGAVLKSSTDTGVTLKDDSDVSGRLSSATSAPSNSITLLSNDSALSLANESTLKPKLRSEIPVSSLNSPSLGASSLSKFNFVSDSTANSSNLTESPRYNQEGKEAPHTQIYASNKEKSIASSSLGSGSIELSQNGINKWRPFQYHEGNTDELMAENSRNLTEARRKMSSGADSAENFTGQVLIRKPSVSGCGDFPNTTSTTTTTTVMEHENGPSSQNFSQLHANRDRDSGQTRNEHHYYHHIHYYYHSHGPDGPNPNQRSQFISSGPYPTPGNGNGEFDANRLSGRPPIQQRVITTEGHGPPMGHPPPESYHIISRPFIDPRSYYEMQPGGTIHRKVSQDRGENAGERIHPIMGPERGEQTEGTTPCLPIMPPFERPWEPVRVYLESNTRQHSDHGEDTFGRQHKQLTEAPIPPQPQEQSQLGREEIARIFNFVKGQQPKQPPSPPRDFPDVQNREQKASAGKRPYVSMEKYENLVSYASNLQNSLTALKNRLFALECDKRDEQSVSRPKKKRARRADDQSYRQSDSSAVTLSPFVLTYRTEQLDSNVPTKRSSSKE